MYQRLLTAREARRNEDGFTLIELLIVIVVLGILAGIVVFGVGTFRADANAAAKAASCETVSVAAEAFNAKTGAYPGNISDLLPTATTPGYLKDAPATTLGIGPAITNGVAAGC